MGPDNGLELLALGSNPQDPFDTDQQIEERERRRDDEDEAGHDHSFPQSKYKFCQESGNTRNNVAPAECSRWPWLRPQSKDGGHGEQEHGGIGTAFTSHSAIRNFYAPLPQLIEPV